MSDEALFRLYQLHQVDEQLVDLKRKASGLDVGQKEIESLKQRDAESKAIREEAQRLHTEWKAAVAQREELSAKKAKFEKQLYDGSISNAREIENLQKEVAMLGQLLEKNALGEADLKRRYDAVAPQAQVEEQALRTLKKAALAKQEAAKTDHAALNEAYKKVAAGRAARAAKVTPDLMKVYDATRVKTHGTGMALVDDKRNCLACGNPVPERNAALVRLGKVVHCESCRRILFYIRPAEASE